MELAAWVMYLGVCVLVYAGVWIAERIYIAIVTWWDGV